MIPAPGDGWSRLSPRKLLLDPVKVLRQALVPVFVAPDRREPERHAVLVAPPSPGDHRPGRAGRHPVAHHPLPPDRHPDPGPPRPAQQEHLHRAARPGPQRRPRGVPAAPHPRPAEGPDRHRRRRRPHRARRPGHRRRPGTAYDAAAAPCAGPSQPVAEPVEADGPARPERDRARRRAAGQDRLVVAALRAVQPDPARARGRRRRRASRSSPTTCPSGTRRRSPRSGTGSASSHSWPSPPSCSSAAWRPGSLDRRHRLRRPVVELPPGARARVASTSPPACSPRARSRWRRPRSAASSSPNRCSCASSAGPSCRPSRPASRTASRPVLPPCPRDVAVSVGEAVLAGSGPLTDPLVEHGPARPAPCLAAPGARLAGAAGGGRPSPCGGSTSPGGGRWRSPSRPSPWPPSWASRRTGTWGTTSSATTSSPAAARWPGCGRCSRPTASSAGSQQSWWQRRIGLADLVATTAAGAERVLVRDVRLDVGRRPGRRGDARAADRRSCDPSSRS